MFCRNCGKEVAQNAEVCLACGVRPSNGTKFCNNCGVETNANQEICVKCGVRLAGASGGGMSSADEDKVMCVLSYLGILCLIPYLTKKQNPTVMFHAKQGLVLLIVEAIAWVAFWFILFIPFLGWMLARVLDLVLLGCFIISIIGIIQAVQGNRWKIPVLGDYAEKL
jgi:uncharacterized membrane protein/RNA polymerase subunit RPABC4/transcription elongation factor Spt4